MPPLQGRGVLLVSHHRAEAQGVQLTDALPAGVMFREVSRAPRFCWV